jgi:hypothetical protein
MKETAIKLVNFTKKNLKLLVCLSLIIVFLVPVITQASKVDPYGVNYVANAGIGKKDPRAIAADLIKLAMSFLGTIAVILILYGGLKWMIAGGSQDKIDEAKKTLWSGFIGLVIIVAAYAIAAYVIEAIIQATQ